MKKTFVALALSLIVTGQPVIALSVDEVVAGLRAEGYSRVEVKMGPTQMKVEAIRGMQKLEIVYDRTTGAVLKTEVESVRPGGRDQSGSGHDHAED
jgi:hypothetical protein